MPKNDEQLQQEHGGELGNRKAYNVTPIQDDYPRIISNVSKGTGVEKTMGPDSPAKFRVGYDEERKLSETNMRMQYVKVNQIEEVK